MPVYEGPANDFLDVPPDVQMFNPIKVLLDELAVLNVSVTPFVDDLPKKLADYPTTAKQFNCNSQDEFYELAGRIAAFGKNVRFYRMHIPTRGVLAAHTFLVNNVWARYVAYYHCPTDSVQGRWDILVEAL